EPGRGEVHHDRPEAPGAGVIREHPAPPDPAGHRYQEGLERPALGHARDGAALQAARRGGGAQHRPVQPGRAARAQGAGGGRRGAMRVSSKVDSRTILDSNGAEQLLGSGDMLFIPAGSARLVRLHGPLVTEVEATRIVAFLKKQARPQYDESVTREEPQAGAGA